MFKKILIANRGEIACRVIRTAKRDGTMIAALCAAVLLVAAPAGAESFSNPVPIQIGVSHSVASVALKEPRAVTVVLPASYGKEAQRRYPVIYLIDGGVEQDLLHVAGVAQLGAMWGRSSEAIVVGLETKDRRRELVSLTRDPELRKKFPTAGSSAAFRQFIRDEVKPLIEGAYRVNGEDVVIGESLAGLFILETFIDEPSLFDGFAAIDPSLWWDDEALSKAPASKIGAAQSGRRLYLAMAKEQSETPAAMRRLVAKFSQAGANLCVADRPDLTHATIYQQLTPQALQYLVPTAEAPPSEFGFEVKCSQRS